MGKKNNKKVGSKNGPVKLLPQIRTDLGEIVDTLFKKCIKISSNTSASQEWTEFLEIYELTEKIISYEKDIKLPIYNRMEQLDTFVEWFKKKGGQMNSLKISDYGEEGLGLKATADIEEAKPVLIVPKSIIMCEDTARQSFLASLIERDPILQQMSNVSLSLHVLGEYVAPNSPWAPYLRSLPSTYSTCLYFTPENIKLLKGSPVLDEVVKQFRNIARQYSYFYRIFQTLPEARSWPIKDYFTFDAYRWAVSTVMSRVNRIPSESATAQLALIPAWDMANHEYGWFSTGFNDSTEKVSCFAFRQFSKGEQFKIYYGQRTNAEFFLNGGFVYKGNLDERVSLRLGVSKSDSSFDDKSELLNSIGVHVSGVFHIQIGSVIISPNLLAFSRVFNMDKETLEKWKNFGEEKRKELLKEDCDVGAELEKKSGKFLHTRISLLLRAYPTTLQEDEDRVKSCSGTELLIVSLLIQEKKLLRDALSDLSFIL